MVPKIVGDWTADSSGSCSQLVARLVEMLHVLMYVHGGFPELYDPVYEVIKVRIFFFPQILASLLQERLHEANLYRIDRVAQRPSANALPYRSKLCGFDPQPELIKNNSLYFPPYLEGFLIKLN